MAKRKPFTATDENLAAHALAPAMRWLIAVALDGSTMTYGEIKDRLEAEAGFSTVFTTRIGFVAGELMNKIQIFEPNAPLINVLVVNQEDRQPSKGAGSYMAERFSEPRLARKGAKERYPVLWEESFSRAAAEVYELTSREWGRLYDGVFKDVLNRDTIESERRQRRKGTEQDGTAEGRNYGAGGEGAFHKALRLWVWKNPGAIRKSFQNFSTETEVDLDSGDRIYVVYKGGTRIIILEVKSRISNEVDLRRGVYQCIKYRAVRQAMDVRNNLTIETYLVTEEKLSGEIAALLKFHNIRHFRAPLRRE